MAAPVSFSRSLAGTPALDSGWRFQEGEGCEPNSWDTVAVAKLLLDQLACVRPQSDRRVPTRTWGRKVPQQETVGREHFLSLKSQKALCALQVDAANGPFAEPRGIGLRLVRVDIHDRCQRSHFREAFRVEASAIDSATRPGGAKKTPKLPHSDRPGGHPASDIPGEPRQFGDANHCR